MMHGPEKSDPAIVAMNPANKAEQSAAESVERRAGTKGNADQQSTYRTQSRQTCHRRWNAYGRWPATASPSHTQGGRSYGAGGGGCGTFIVHTNRWRLPRGPNQ